MQCERKPSARQARQGARNTTSPQKTRSRRRKTPKRAQRWPPPQRIKAAVFFIRNPNDIDKTARLTPFRPNMSETIVTVHTFLGNELLGIGVAYTMQHTTASEKGLRLHIGHLFTKGELREPPPEPPEEERPRLGPRHHLPHRAPGFHSSRRVVKVGELHGNLHRDGHQHEKLATGSRRRG